MIIVNKDELIHTLAQTRYIIADKFMLTQHKDISRSLEKASVFFLDNPEKSKNLAIYQKAINFFITNGLTRKDHLVVLGGGATSDFGGFVASTILRGISWTVIPTTLLSAVDASIGGKVGLNTDSGKNLIGNFHLPLHNYFCIDFLSTLSKREHESGFGEVIKYAFLDASIYKLLLEDEYDLREIIKQCAHLKQQLVETDFKEVGERKLLNLGHTFGHAFEKLLNIPHGHAVILGLELILKVFSPDLAPDFEQLKFKLGLRVEPERCSFEKFWNKVRVDKKIINKREIELIIPRSIGRVEIEKVELETLKKKLVCNEYYKNYFN